MRRAPQRGNPAKVLRSIPIKGTITLTLPTDHGYYRCQLHHLPEGVRGLKPPCMQTQLLTCRRGLRTRKATRLINVSVSYGTANRRHGHMISTVNRSLSA